MPPCYLTVCLPVFLSMGWPAFPCCSPGTLACINRAAGDLPVEKKGKDDCHLPYWELCLNENWVMSQSGPQGWVFHTRAEQQRSPCSPALKPWAGGGSCSHQPPSPEALIFLQAGSPADPTHRKTSLANRTLSTRGDKELLHTSPHVLLSNQAWHRGRQYNGTSMKHHVDWFSPQGKGERSFSPFHKPQVLCIDF